MISEKQITFRTVFHTKVSPHGILAIQAITFYTGNQANPPSPLNATIPAKSRYRIRKELEKFTSFLRNKAYYMDTSLINQQNSQFNMRIEQNHQIPQREGDLC